MAAVFGGSDGGAYGATGDKTPEQLAAERAAYTSTLNNQPLGNQQMMGNGWYDSNSGNLLGTVDPSQQAYNNFYAGQSTGMTSAPQYPGSQPQSSGGGMGGTSGAYQMPGQGGAVFGGSSGGSQNLGMGSSGGAPGAAGMATGGNPYVGQMADAITQQATQAFNRNVLPGIGSQAMATGGYGGSRQGVIEANAMNDLGQNLTNSLAGLQGSAYNTGLNYDLGLRNNNLGFANLDRNINNDNNSWALQGANFGLGVNNQLNANAQTGINSGTTIQNTPQTYWNNFSQGANSIGKGYGTSTGSTNMPGSPITGMLGGAQLGQQAANWWSSQPTANSTGGANGAGWGTGAAYGNNDFGSYF